jgi:hypothetical protein
MSKILTHFLNLMIKYLTTINNIYNKIYFYKIEKKSLNFGRWYTLYTV